MPEQITTMGEYEEALNEIVNKYKGIFSSEKEAYEAGKAYLSLYNTEGTGVINFLEQFTNKMNTALKVDN